MSRLASRLSPELVALLLSAIVVVVVVGVRLPARPADQPAPSATPTGTVRPSASDRLSSLVRSSLATIIVVNGRLAAVGLALQSELARTSPRVGEVAILLPRITAEITAVSEPVRQLVAEPATAALGVDLETAYGSLAGLVRTTLRESVQNGKVYLVAAGAAAKKIAAIAPLTQRAQAILDGRLESPAPSATPSRPPASPSASPSAPAPTPSATRSPTSIPSAAAGGLIVNPGFETGLDPWLLQLVPPAAATLTQDRTNPAAGTAAARIDIQAASDSRSGISLIQPGLALRAGQTYTVKVMLRAGAARDVRIRLAAANGDTYVVRIFALTSSWTSISFPVGVLVDDPAAELAIDVGQSSVSVWVDEAAVLESSG